MLIVEYDNSLSEKYENFRHTTFSEHNDSLKESKINPNNFDGKIWCVLHEDVIISSMALENDHYTNTENVARICRYHIIKKYRHGRYGFKMLDKIYEYAKTRYKLIYWTHDIENFALNDLYQHKRVYYDNKDNSYFHREPFTLLKLNKEFLFRAGDMYQYVYYIKFDSEFEWKPKTSVYWTHHNGDLLR